VPGLTSNFINNCRKTFLKCRDDILGSNDFVRKCSVSLRYVEQSVNSLLVVQSKISDALALIQV
jgi:hypothetical protein